MGIDEVASISLRTPTSITNADRLHTGMVPGATGHETLNVAATASAANMAAQARFTEQKQALHVQVARAGLEEPT